MLSTIRDPEKPAPAAPPGEPFDASKSPRSPIIFVGGLACATIDADLDREKAAHFYCAKKATDLNLWFKLSHLLPFRAGCWSDDMRLRWDANQNDSAAGPQVRDIGVNSYLPGVKNYPLNSTGNGAEGMLLDLYGFLEGNLTQSLGYQPEEMGNWYYDFRLGPEIWAQDGSFQRLKTQVEMYYNQSNPIAASGETVSAKRVILVSISMGGPVIQAFLYWLEDPRFWTNSPTGKPPGKAWKSKYLERWVSLSGVFGGTSMMIPAVVYPDNADAFMLQKVLPYVNWQKIRDMAASWPGMLWLNPQVLKKDEILVRVAHRDSRWPWGPVTWRNYTQSDIPKLLAETPGMAKEIAAVYKSLEPWSFENMANFADLGVDMDCVHGSDVPLPRGYSYDNGLERPPTVFRYDTDGDKVVNGESLQLCRRFNTSVESTSGGLGDGSTGFRFRELVYPHLQHGWEIQYHGSMRMLIQTFRDIATENAAKASAVQNANADSVAYI